ncbi:B-cell receptor-associated protein 31-like isoform X2 [Limulus polyphemus]|uniref:Endoplasmic reticulum transmembrane protein n=1 Tax=Limulus polyphemus TaxID=6850 RepID=A0ABM1TEH3_LIMPO|nr:B-cell receptor-associated protein 31-like isoform X2 [Limulus polyphemus]
MSIQWTLIASFLYGEIAVVGLLLLPFISSLRWARILKSRLFRLIRERINIYFGILFFFHLICFFDAVREMRKYSSTEVSDHDTLSTELQRNMRLFRAQRNFHIMLFTFFLLFVIRRLVSLILNQATLAAQCEASVLQARRATETAERLMQEKERQFPPPFPSGFQYFIELEHLKKDRNSMKAQAESVNKEYDRLVKEYAKLQEELDMITGSSSVKKDE